jgi:uncharacterized protein DUF6448
MPPHCDSMDGPVVKMARKAIDSGNVDLILPYVPADGEDEVTLAFDKVMAIRKSDGKITTEVADTYFFETVVRVHRAGEGAPYTGLKPAGLDVGPVIPVAEMAIESGTPDQLVDLMTGMLKDHIQHRFEEMQQLKAHADHGVEHTREYVEAMLGLQVWSHKVYLAMKSSAHEGDHEHGQAEVHKHG